MSKGAFISFVICFLVLRESPKINPNKKRTIAIAIKITRKVDVFTTELSRKVVKMKLTRSML